MRAASVAVSRPFGDGLPGVIKAKEQRVAQQFVPAPPAEALHEAVLHGLGGYGVSASRRHRLMPSEDRMRGEARTLLTSTFPRPRDNLGQCIHISVRLGTINVLKNKYILTLWSWERRQK